MIHEYKKTILKRVSKQTSYIYNNNKIGKQDQQIDTNENINVLSILMMIRECLYQPVHATKFFNYHT